MSKSVAEMLFGADQNLQEAYRIINFHRSRADEVERLCLRISTWETVASITHAAFVFMDDRERLAMLVGQDFTHVPAVEIVKPGLINTERGYFPGAVLGFFRALEDINPGHPGYKLDVSVGDFLVRVVHSKQGWIPPNKAYESELSEAIKKFVRHKPHEGGSFRCIRQAQVALVFRKAVVPFSDLGRLVLEQLAYGLFGDMLLESRLEMLGSYCAKPSPDRDDGFARSLANAGP